MASGSNDIDDAETNRHEPLLLGGAPWRALQFLARKAPRDHSLTEYDGRIHAERHNRARLRRAVKDVRQNLNHIRIQPLRGSGQPSH